MIPGCSDNYSVMKFSNLKKLWSPVLNYYHLLYLTIKSKTNLP